VNWWNGTEIEIGVSIHPASGSSSHISSESVESPSALLMELQGISRTSSDLKSGLPTISVSSLKFFCVLCAPPFQYHSPSQEGKLDFHDGQRALQKGQCSSFQPLDRGRENRQHGTDDRVQRHPEET
jgi:hypothetical protein